MSSGCRKYRPLFKTEGGNNIRDCSYGIGQYLSSACTQNTPTKVIDLVPRVLNVEKMVINSITAAGVDLHVGLRYLGLQMEKGPDDQVPR